MSILEWCGLGAFFIAILFFCARIMRRGITSLDEDRKQYMERIKNAERQIAEDRKNICSHDQLVLIRAALEDLLRLEGNPEGYSIQKQHMGWELVTPEGSWHIKLLMREQSLRSNRKVLHGRSRWFLSGFNSEEHHMDPASLMHSLNNHLHSKYVDKSIPQHLARRLGGIGAITQKF